MVVYFNWAMRLNKNQIEHLAFVIPEAGGTLTSWSGEDPAVENIDHPEYRWSAIASNGAFHDRLVEVLAR